MEFDSVSITSCNTAFLLLVDTSSNNLKHVTSALCTQMVVGTYLRSAYVSWHYELIPTLLTHIHLHWTLVHKQSHVKGIPYISLEFCAPCIGRLLSSFLKTMIRTCLTLPIKLALSTFIFPSLCEVNEYWIPNISLASYLGKYLWSNL